MEVIKQLWVNGGTNGHVSVGERSCSAIRLAGEAGFQEVRKETPWIEVLRSQLSVF